MPLTSPALQAAAGALQRISENNPGERGHRAAVVALVLRAIEQVMGDVDSSAFILRRAELEIDDLRSRRERSFLRRILVKALEESSGGIGTLLSDYAGALEEARRLPESETVLTLARALDPARAELALRSARVARLQGDRQGALELYAVARQLDDGDGSIARLASIGEAVVAEEPELALSRAIRRAVLAGDQEAAAVGIEERGRCRRQKGDRSGAARDFAVAAVRYRDAVDRGRVGHQLADLFVAEGDGLAAKEALHFTLEVGDRSQQDHARARLHTVCRDLGDQLGMRRWRSFDKPALVSLSSRPTARVGRSRAAAVSRWRDRVEGRFALSQA